VEEAPPQEETVRGVTARGVPSAARGLGARGVPLQRGVEQPAVEEATSAPQEPAVATAAAVAPAPARAAQGLRRWSLEERGTGVARPDTQKAIYGVARRAAAAASAVAALTPHEPETTPEGDEWYVLPEPIFTILDPDLFDQSRGVFTTDVSTSFVMGQDKLEKDLVDYWREIETEIVDDLYGNHDQVTVNYKDRNGKMQKWRVGMSDLDDVISTSISGLPADASNSVFIGRYNDDDELIEEIPMNARDLASKIMLPGYEMSIEEYISSRTPQVVAIYHGHEGQTEITPGTKYGQATIINNGKWVIEDQFLGEERMSVRRPHAINNARPIDMV
jgi:hypothetical protein